MGYRKGHSAMRGYSYKELKKILGTQGFFEHHRNSAHMIFANEEGYYVTVPCSDKKEINHMMCTVTLQRIKNKHCRRL